MSALLAVEGLRVGFGRDPVANEVVKGVSFAVGAGETLAIVGESGSGKSVTALSINRLVDFGGGRITGGSIVLTRADGSATDLVTAGEDQLVRIRGGEIGMIFQEPMTSLNPVHTVGSQIEESFRLHRGLSGGAATAAAKEALDRVIEHRPSLLVSDIGMPGEDGYSLIRKIRALGPEFGGNMPAVALTAYASADDRARSVDAGYQRHMSKPVESTKLIRTLAGLINLRYFLATHHIPTIHPAAMVLFVVFAAASLLLKKAFCSWLCPVGAASEYLWKLGRKVFGRNLDVPKWLDLPLRILVWQDADAKVWLTWDDPEELVARHHLSGASTSVIDTIGKGVMKIAHAAAQ